MNNNIFLLGRLTKDIDYRSTENGMTIGSFTLAVQREYKNASGNYDTDFINCIAYKQIADLLHNYTKKGDKIGVRGRLQTRSYEKDGEKKYITEVIVDKSTILMKKEEPKEEPKHLEDINEIVLTEDDLPF